MLNLETIAYSIVYMKVQFALNLIKDSVRYIIAFIFVWSNYSRFKAKSQNEWYLSFDVRVVL